MNEKYLLKLQNDIFLRNFTPSTGENYIRYVTKFLGHTGKDAMSITYADIRKFAFHLKDAENKKPSTINGYTAAIRFFFEHTLGYIWDEKKVPKMKLDKKLPAILTLDEVFLLIDSIGNLKHKAMVSTMYSSGLRVSEVCRLRYDDIRRSQKKIYVSKSKSRQDRYAILSDNNLEILSEYWRRGGRPMGWLFPSTMNDGPLAATTVARFMKNYVGELGYPNNVTPHSLRHSFAVHLLEGGVSKTYIQQLLGHLCPSSTDCYLQMTSKALMGIKSPFDRGGGGGGNG